MVDHPAGRGSSPPGNDEVEVMIKWSSPPGNDEVMGHLVIRALLNLEIHITDASTCKALDDLGKHLMLTFSRVQ